jgi:hypothetical protein
LVAKTFKIEGAAEKEELGAFLDIVKEVESDPEGRRRMEENQRRYGTLTEEELKKVFTI